MLSSDGCIHRVHVQHNQITGHRIVEHNGVRIVDERILCDIGSRHELPLLRHEKQPRISTMAASRTAERVLLLAGQGGQPSGQTQASIWRSILERRGADVVEARVATRGRRPRFEPTEHFTVVVSSCASLSITRKKLSQCGVAAELYDGARIVDGVAGGPRFQSWHPGAH